MGTISICFFEVSLGKLLFTIEAITKTHNQSEGRLVKPNPNRCIYKTPVHLSPREHCRKGGVESV